MLKQRRTRKYIILGIGLLHAFVSYAVTPKPKVPNCLAHKEVELLEDITIETPKPLPRHPNAKFHPWENQIAGSVLSSAKDIAHVEDGTYIFTMDKKRTIFAPRNFDHIDRPLNTHRTLELFHQINFPKEKLKIIAGGEVDIIDGKIVGIRNKMGTYPYQKQMHIDYALHRFRKLEVPVIEGIKGVDFSSTEMLKKNIKKKLDPETGVEFETDGFHTYDLAEARLAYQFEHDPELKTIAKRLKEMRRDFHRRYPSVAKPGHIDANLFFSSTRQIAKKAEEDDFMFSNVDSILVGLDKPQEFYFYVNRIIFGVKNERGGWDIAPLGIKKTKELIESIPEYEGYFN